MPMVSMHNVLLSLALEWLRGRNKNLRTAVA
jgi:hypothetical protein